MKKARKLGILVFIFLLTLVIEVFIGLWKKIKKTELFPGV